MANIQFIDLQAQRAHLGSRIDEAMNRVLDHGKFIMGPEVKQLEEKLSIFGKMEHTVSCSNGTDAISLALMAMDIGPGDAVFVPSFTFAATAEVVALTGATPVFVDIYPDTFNMDVAHLNAGGNTGKITQFPVVINAGAGVYDYAISNGNVWLNDSVGADQR